MKVREGSLRVVTEPRRDGETADDYIVRVAVSTRDRGKILDVPVRVVAVATNDKLVRAACKSVDIPVVSLRQKRYLTVS